MVTKVLRIHPLVTLECLHQILWHTSNSWDVSVWTKRLTLLQALLKLKVTNCSHWWISKIKSTHNLYLMGFKCAKSLQVFWVCSWWSLDVWQHFFKQSKLHLSSKNTCITSALNTNSCYDTKSIKSLLYHTNYDHHYCGVSCLHWQQHQLNITSYLIV